MKELTAHDKYQIDNWQHLRIMMLKLIVSLSIIMLYTSDTR